MTIAERETEVVEEFSFYENWMDKYEHIISLGKSLPLIDEKYKNDDYIVRGCQSKVWLAAEYRNGKVYFTADSDAIITKGLVSLLIGVLNESTPDEIIEAKTDFIDTIGLKEHLSLTRSNGLIAMIREMKTYAVGFKAKTAKA